MTSFALKYIIPYISDFHYLYPSLKISLSLSDNLVNLVEEEIDVAIRIGALKDSSMIIYPLTSNKRILCASPEYIEKFNRPETIEDLYNHNCLVFKTRPNWYFFKDNKTTELKPNAIIETNNGEALHSLTTSGLGISVLTVWLIKNDLENKKLEILLPDYQVNTTNSLESEIYILYPNKKFLPLKIKLFIDFVKKCMAVNGMTHL